MKLFLRPNSPAEIRIVPMERIQSVVFVVPAGASVPALAEAIFAGNAPIVNVKLALWGPDVIATALSPDSAVVGVHDQLPEVSAVAVTAWLPTVPVTAAPAVVMPENVGVAEVTQKCVAP